MAAGLSRYEAPAGCPSRGALALPDHDGSSPPSLDLHIQKIDDQFRATLEVHDSPSRTSTRTFDAPTCEEATSAARLVAALLLSLPLSPPEPPPARPVPPSTDAPPSPSPASAATDAPDLGIALAVRARGGVGPSVRLAPGLSLRWRPREDRSLDLGALYARSATLSRGGDAYLSLLSASLAGCFVVARPAPRLAALPCAVVELGALSGTGQRVSNASSVSRLHLAAGTAARLEFSFSPSIHLSIQATLLALASRPRFYFGPDTTVYRPPWLVAAGGADLTLLFL